MRRDNRQNPIWYSQGIAAQRQSLAAWAQGWRFTGRGALRVHVSCSDPLGSGARSSTRVISARRPRQADCQ